MNRNPWLCITIVYMLGVCAALCILGMIILPLFKQETPSSLMAIAGTCIGSLASFLVSVPRGSVGFDEPRLPPAK